MSESVSSIFNFDVPVSEANKICTLEFLFPLHAQLETSSYIFSGPGQFHVSALKGPATVATTYNSVPAVWADLGGYNFIPGTATTIGSWPCAAGAAIGVLIKATNGTMLNFFQDYNPCRTPGLSPLR